MKVPQVDGSVPKVFSWRSGFSARTFGTIAARLEQAMAEEINELKKLAK